MKIMIARPYKKPTRIVGYMRRDTWSFSFFLSDGTVLLNVLDESDGHYYQKITNIKEIDVAGMALLGSVNFDITPDNIAGTSSIAEVDVEVKWMPKQLETIKDYDEWDEIKQPMQVAVNANDTFGEDMEDGYEDDYGSEYGILYLDYKGQPERLVFYGMKDYFTKEFVDFIRSAAGSTIHIV